MVALKTLITQGGSVKNPAESECGRIKLIKLSELIRLIESMVNQLCGRQTEKISLTKYALLIILVILIRRSCQALRAVIARLMHLNHQNG